MTWVTALAAAGKLAALTGMARVSAVAPVVYRVRRAPDEVLSVRTPDGWSLRMLHYRPAPGSEVRAEPVILCHGLCTNSFHLDLGERYSLARYLSARGFHAMVPDLRGRQASLPEPGLRREPHDYSFDHHVRVDAPLLVEAALERTGARRAFWIGHSMGGMIGYLLAAARAGRVAGLVTLGAPVGVRPERLVAHCMRLALALPFDPLPYKRACRAVAPLAGRRFPPVPDFSALRCNMDIPVIRAAMANAIEDLPRRVLRQFAHWSSTGRFSSECGDEDYRCRLPEVRAPLLCIAANADRLAPPVDVRVGFELVRSDDRAFVCIGEDVSGSTACYGHGDVLLGRDAPDLVYPLIATWLEQRATRPGGRLRPLRRVAARASAPTAVRSIA